ncbi:MAG TPA: hypothetical protein DD381_11645 [Lentisphaeria bacterium]|nr:MAG: hypothetical protein A2X47_08965 [Lentisphaerae bacterium GWF2_38_69]HBM16981.1 hypothetical protein [Lentisphaeria bacterium]
MKIICLMKLIWIIFSKGKHMRIIFLLLLPFIIASSVIYAESDKGQHQGVYAQIDTKKDIQVIDLLLNGNKEEQNQTAKKIVEHSDQYCPAVLFYLARYFFYQNKDEDAIFWLYAARIRILFDIKRCTDLTVEDSSEAMSYQMPNLLRIIQFENIDNSKVLFKKALEWDKQTPHNYDPAWIALHGMGVFLPTSDKTTLESLNIPKEQWTSLAEENRNDYLQDYMEYMDGITPEQLTLMKKKIQELRKEEANNK